MTQLERRIVATIAAAAQEGLEARAIYLTPGDRAEFGGATHAADVPVRDSKGRGRSMLYCRHGIARAIRR